MPWIFEQSSGAMFDPAGVIVGNGYSGAGEGKNNSDMESIHNIGPIPQGKYTMGEPVTSHVHGPYAIPLHPDNENKMFGRDAFLCHGDSMVAPGTASEGCIIQPHDVRIKMWESSDHHLEVVARMGA
jgi:Protein of unknown function (DUF2778)